MVQSKTLPGGQPGSVIGDGRGRWARAKGDGRRRSKPFPTTLEGELIWAWATFMGVTHIQLSTQRATVPIAKTIAPQVFLLQGLMARFANGGTEQPPFLSAGDSGALS